MAEMTHEKMLNVLRRNSTYREMTYQKAVEEGYFQDDPTKRSEYVSLIKAYVKPVDPAAAASAPAVAPVAPAGGTPAPVAGTPAGGTPAPVAGTPAGGTPAPVAGAPAAVPAPVVPTPAPAVPAPAPVAPAAPLTPAEMYAKLSPYDKQMLLTDMAIPLYQNRESSNSWLSTGIGGLVVGGILSIANLMTPAVSVDETVIQYQIQRHKADVVEYERVRGKSPPWVMSDDQIRSKNTSDNSPWKKLMFYTGLAALILGAGSTAVGTKKRLE